MFRKKCSVNLIESVVYKATGRRRSSGKRIVRTLNMGNCGKFWVKMGQKPPFVRVKLIHINLWNYVVVAEGSKCCV